MRTRINFSVNNKPLLTVLDVVSLIDEDKDFSLSDRFADALSAETPEEKEIIKATFEKMNAFWKTVYFLLSEDDWEMNGDVDSQTEELMYNYQNEVPDEHPKLLFYLTKDGAVYVYYAMRSLLFDGVFRGKILEHTYTDGVLSNTAVFSFSSEKENLDKEVFRRFIDDLSEHSAVIHEYFDSLSDEESEESEEDLTEETEGTEEESEESEPEAETEENEEAETESEEETAEPQNFSNVLSNGRKALGEFFTKHPPLAYLEGGLLTLAFGGIIAATIYANKNYTQKRQQLYDYFKQLFVDHTNEWLSPEDGKVLSGDQMDSPEKYFKLDPPVDRVSKRLMGLISLNNGNTIAAGMMNKVYNVNPAIGFDGDFGMALSTDDTHYGKLHIGVYDNAGQLIDERILRPNASILELTDALTTLVEYNK
ncbi:MAG: hypothetical protein MJZ34_02735 [Paludibacteraceae bacterium]|nr:hypothetical protein [Paludibacteraceae bacterium]